MQANLRTKPTRRRRQRPYIPRPALQIQSFEFTLDNWDDEWIKLRLRFTRQEIRRILPLLYLEQVTYQFRYNPAPEKALCIVLARLAWPNRLADLMPWFGCSRSQLSVIFNDVVMHLFNLFREKLYWPSSHLSVNILKSFAQAIGRLGGGDRVWGWLDGTIVKIARPEVNQGLSYTGYKKSHGLKFQGIVTPNGLLASFAGPVVAGKSDFALLQICGICEKIENLWRKNGIPESEELYLYGDPAYCSSSVCIGPYKQPPVGRLTPSQQLFNTQMSSCRIEVEHGFGLVKNLWKLLDLKSGLRTGNSPVASWVGYAVLFTNIFTYLRGN